MLPLVLCALSAAPVEWRYRAQFDDARQLGVSAAFPPGVSEELSVGDGAEPFVHDVAVKDGEAWRPIPARGTSWFIPACKKGCEVRYRLDLAGLARRADEVDLAKTIGPVIVAAADSWLLRPLEGEGESTLALDVSPPKGSAFAIGWPRNGTGYRARAKDIPMGPYAAFGPLDARTVPVGDRTLQIAFAPMKRTLSQDRIAAWIRESADAVRLYEGVFPIDQALVLVVPSDDLNGKTLGSGGATVVLWLGADVTEAGLRGEWVLVHELAHLTLPSVTWQHHWLEEGVATYVEPLARLRVEQLAAPEVWRQLTWGLPKGLPGWLDAGLDNTHSWGRTYWGGALYWFLADIRIRERTQNRCSIQDALRGIREAGGNLGEHWEIERVLAAGDAKVEGHELEGLYQALGSKPGSVDLGALFKKLGVKREGDAITFDPKAPEAAIREGITSTAPTHCP